MLWMQIFFGMATHWILATISCTGCSLNDIRYRTFEILSSTMFPSRTRLIRVTQVVSGISCFPPIFCLSLVRRTTLLFNHLSSTILTPYTYCDVSSISISHLNFYLEPPLLSRKRHQAPHLFWVQKNNIHCIEAVNILLNFKRAHAVLSHHQVK